jgi:hypothetical protein
MDTHRDSQEPASESLSLRPLGTFSHSHAIVVAVSGGPGRRIVDYAVAVALHAVVVAILVIVPLLFLSELHSPSFTEAAVITTVPPALGEPGPYVSGPREIPRKILPPVRLDKPIWRPGRNPAAPPGPPPALSINAPGLSDGIESSLFSHLDRAPLLVAPVCKPENETFRRGGNFKLPRVVRGVSIDYPEVAKQLRLMGQVILQGIVDERGNVHHMRRVSGPALLAEAAADAVLKEKFAPATLNGEPTVCDLIVVVTFKLFGP